MVGSHSVEVTSVFTFYLDADLLACGFISLTYSSFSSDLPVKDIASGTFSTFIFLPNSWRARPRKMTA
jgi:hypothetical protein